MIFFFFFFFFVCSEVGLASWCWWCYPYTSSNYTKTPGLRKGVFQKTLRSSYMKLCSIFNVGIISYYVEMQKKKQEIIQITCSSIVRTFSGFSREFFPDFKLSKFLGCMHARICSAPLSLARAASYPNGKTTKKTIPRSFRAVSLTWCRTRGSGHRRPRQLSSSSGLPSTRLWSSMCRIASLFHH